MPNLKYGPIAKKSRVEDGSFKASQIIHERGAAFCLVDGSGDMEIAAAASTELFGYALVGFSNNDPHVTGNPGSKLFTTTSTAGAIKYSYMVGDPSTIYFVPSDAAYAATDKGIDCDIVVTSNKQMADIGTSSTNVLRVVGGKVGDSEVRVSIKAAVLQV